MNDKINENSQRKTASKKTSTNTTSKTKLNKNDILLIIVVIFLSVCALIGYRLFYHQSGSFVQVTVDGKVYKELPLDEDNVILIEGKGGTNKLSIHNGYADMTDADCPDKLCVKQKKIHYNGESLICLPHKVVVTVISDKESQLDGIAS